MDMHVITLSIQKKKYAKEQLYAKSKKLGIWNMNFDPKWEKKCG